MDIKKTLEEIMSKPVQPAFWGRETQPGKDALFFYQTMNNGRGSTYMTEYSAHTENMEGRTVSPDNNKYAETAPKRIINAAWAHLQSIYELKKFSSQGGDDVYLLRMRSAPKSRYSESSGCINEFYTDTTFYFRVSLFDDCISPIALREEEVIYAAKSSTPTWKGNLRTLLFGPTPEKTKQQLFFRGDEPVLDYRSEEPYIPPDKR